MEGVVLPGCHAQGLVHDPHGVLIPVTTNGSYREKDIARMLIPMTVFRTVIEMRIGAGMGKTKRPHAPITLHNNSEAAPGRKGGVFRVESGHPLTDPGTKLDGSFISIQSPSKLTFL